jgi:hypothetical protein
LITVARSVPHVTEINVVLTQYGELNKSTTPTREHNYVAPEDVFEPEETIYHCHLNVTKEPGFMGKPELQVQFGSWRQAVRHPQKWFRFLRDKQLILSRA